MFVLQQALLKLDVLLRETRKHNDLLTAKRAKTRSRAKAKRKDPQQNECINQTDHFQVNIKTSVFHKC